MLGETASIRARGSNSLSHFSTHNLGRPSSGPNFTSTEMSPRSDSGIFAGSLGVEGMCSSAALPFMVVVDRRVGGWVDI